MAETVFEVLKKIPSNNLKKAYLIYQLNQLIQEKVAKNLAEKIRVVDIKKRQVIVETENNAWAQEVTFHKQNLLKIFLENKIPIEDIRVKAANYRAAKDQKKVNIQNYCLECGAEIKEGRNICIKCQNKKERETNSTIKNILLATPWIRYEQLKQELTGTDTNVSEEEFIKTREKLRAQTFDFIKRHSYELYQTPTVKLRREMKKRAEFYTMIKNLLTIDRINDKIIEKTLGGMLYAVIYKNSKDKAKK